MVWIELSQSFHFPLIAFAENDLVRDHVLGIETGYFEKEVSETPGIHEFLRGMCVTLTQ